MIRSRWISSRSNWTAAAAEQRLRCKAYREALGHTNAQRRRAELSRALAPNGDGLLKWSAEVREHPHSQKIYTQEGLESRYSANPARRLQYKIARLCASEPIANAELAKADLEGGQERKVRRPSNSPHAMSTKALDTSWIVQCWFTIAQLDAILRPSAVDAARPLQSARLIPNRPRVDRDRQRPNPGLPGVALGASRIRCSVSAGTRGRHEGFPALGAARLGPGHASAQGRSWAHRRGEDQTTRS